MDHGSGIRDDSPYCCCALGKQWKKKVRDMTTNERILILKKFHIKLRIAEHLHDTYRTCVYRGAVASQEHLLTEENKVTEKEVRMLRECFDEEIKKAGIESDQFVALYHLP